MRRLILHAVASALLVSSCSIASVAQSPAPEGCYVATPALTYSATGNPERGDSSWAVLHLRESGVARRPLLQPRIDARSAWRIAGDTLELIVSDGLAGWRLALLPSAEGWVGIGRYLTDVRVDGPYEPRSVRFSLQRRPCVST